jgi:FSR family fosmidomycin resistance protein-like MFS transporter
MDLSDSENIKFQWAQLLAAAAVHFLVDIYFGMMNTILPAIQARFLLSLTMGGVLLATFNVTCNAVQLLAGHARADKEKPLLMPIGLVLTTLICLIAFLPGTPKSFWMLIVLALISGSGVAITHPEGLRAIHRLNRIPPATGTAVFMASGIGGFAAGGVMSSFLVKRFGMEGLSFLFIIPVIGILLIYLLKIRLAVDPQDGQGQSAAEHNGQKALAFTPIMIMATLAAVSTAAIVWVLPQRLSKLGFDLTFGSFAVMTFMLASCVGSFFWAWLANRKGELFCAIFALFLGIGFLSAYVFWIEQSWALWILFAGSFCCFGVYPLMVSIARTAVGMNLGMRMAMMVGGTWIIASLSLVLFAWIAERAGLFIIHLLAPVGYLLSAIMGIFILRKHTAAAV